MDQGNHVLRECHVVPISELTEEALVLRGETYRKCGHFCCVGFGRSSHSGLHVGYLFYRSFSSGCFLPVDLLLGK